MKKFFGDQHADGTTDNLSSASFDEIYDGMDIDGDGKISYSEFITAAMFKTVLMTESSLRMAFDHLDSDQEGTLDRSKLKAVFETQGTPKNRVDMEKIWDEFIFPVV